MAETRQHQLARHAAVGAAVITGLRSCLLQPLVLLELPDAMQ